MLNSYVNVLSSIAHVVLLFFFMVIEFIFLQEFPCDFRDRRAHLIVSLLDFVAQSLHHIFDLLYGFLQLSSDVLNALRLMFRRTNAEDLLVPIVPIVDESLLLTVIDACGKTSSTHFVRVKLRVGLLQ